MKIRILCTLFVLFIYSLNAQERQAENQASIAILGMFHFGETNDLAAVKMTDLHGEKRQNEIKELVQMLKTYKPTKILVEYPMGKKDTLQKRYEAYLKGNFKLKDSETYQIGFRLAKALGQSQVYAMDHKMDLPFDDLAAHLTKINQMEKMNTMIGRVQGLMQEETKALESLSLSSYLLRLNSEEFDGLANSLYLKEVLEMGTPDNEVGAKVSAIWYQRNMVMLKNIASYIDSPEERILVIVGSSHRAVLRDYIHDRTDLKFVEIAKYLK